MVVVVILHALKVNHVSLMLTVKLILVRQVHVQALAALMIKKMVMKLMLIVAEVVLINVHLIKNVKKIVTALAVNVVLQIIDVLNQNVRTVE